MMEMEAVPKAEILECLWALAADRMHQIEEQLAKGRLSAELAQRLCAALQAILDVRITRLPRGGRNGRRRRPRRDGNSRP